MNQQHPIIRPYQATDHPQMLKLFEAFQDYLIALDPLKRLRRQPGYAEQYIQKTIKETAESGCFLVAEIEGALIGLVAGFIKYQEPEDLLDCIPSQAGWVSELYVSPEYRSSGLGQKLITEIETFFRNTGCDIARLEVFEPNHFARMFYQKVGYLERSIELIKPL